MRDGKKNFERRENIPQYWYNKSCDLRASAGVIWYGIHGGQAESIVDYLKLGSGFSLPIATFPIFWFLCGLSLELLFKAIIVTKKEKVPSNHFLIDLSEKAEIKLTDQEKGFLEILTESVIWDGKYPVPLDPQMENYEKLNNLVTRYLFDEVESPGNFKILRPNRSFNWESFNDLWEKGSCIFGECRGPDSVPILRKISDKLIIGGDNH